MSSGVRFALDGLWPVDPPSLYDRRRVWEGDLSVLAEYHETDGTGRNTSYLLAHDTSVTWSVPGQPQVASLVIRRDPQVGLYQFGLERHSLAPLGQAWLIARGCPPDPILRLAEGLPRPADEETRAVEARLLASADGLHIRDSWTDGTETWVLAHDFGAAVLPARVFLEVPDLDAGTYRLTEGAFPTAVAARDWLRGDRVEALPPPPGPAFVDRRTRAASARSVQLPSAPTRGSQFPPSPPLREPRPGPRWSR
ncbi:hypothetical protein OG983_30700 [Streptomyces jietaisiensis]|uniref:hypothetical protein n=1 Tax=Streptomyces griseoaurantiacus TaxID=68213 RepID=UPI002E3373D6|nr:hypothetical protein [Streptomyces jietaisiensis]